MFKRIFNKVSKKGFKLSVRIPIKKKNFKRRRVNGYLIDYKSFTDQWLVRKFDTIKRKYVTIKTFDKVMDAISFVKKKK